MEEPTVICEPLFPDITDDAVGVNCDMDVRFGLATIARYQARLEKIIALEEQENEWFRKQKLEIATKVDRAQEKLRLYLIQTDQKTVVTPEGKVTLVNRMVKHWPEDTVLLDWASRQNHGGAVLVAKKESEKPDRKAIAKYIDEWKVTPPGYCTSEERSLSISWTKKDEQPADSLMVSAVKEDTW